MHSICTLLTCLLLVSVVESHKVSEFSSKQGHPRASAIKASYRYEDYTNGYSSRGRRAADRPKDHTFCNTTRSLCHTVPKLSSIYSTLLEIADRHPEKTKLTMVSKSYKGRPIYCLQIFRKSDIVDFGTAVIDFGMHGREWASTSSALYVINKLIDDDGLINVTRWFIFPVLNPDGYHYSTKVNNMWTKNRRRFDKENCVGVDVNRNFDVGWYVNLEDDPCQDNYAGPGPFSEVESRAIKHFMDNLEPYAIDIYVSVRSCGQAILYPYAYTENGISSWKLYSLRQAGLVMAKEMKKLRNRNYDVEVAYKFGGLRSHSADYMFDRYHIPYVFTLELGDRIFLESYNFHHCYHPPTTDEMEYLNKECYAGLVSLAQYVRNSTVLQTLRNVPVSFNSAPMVFLSVEVVTSVILLLPTRIHDY